MKLRFQADNDLDQRIVVATKRLDPSVDFQTAPALGLHDVDDPEVLALAASEGRVLVSRDRKTMPNHFREFIKTSLETAIIYVAEETVAIAQMLSKLRLKFGSHTRLSLSLK